MSQHSFENLFVDYSIESAKEYISGTKLKTIEKFKRFETSTWQKTFKNYKKDGDYSVYTGSSGIALLKILMSKQTSGEEAKTLLREALNLIPIEKLNRRRVTFLCGDAGPLAIAAVIQNELGNVPAAEGLLKNLLAMGEEVLEVEAVLPNEILYGRAGYLFALLYVKDHMPDMIDDSLIRQECARSLEIECPLMYSWHESHYLGAAHGLSGILYMLLQARKYVEDADLTLVIQPSIDYLAAQRFSSGNFPSSLGKDRDKLVQWCHGAPGFTHLFCLAYKVFGFSYYLNMALQCGDVVWNRGILTKGYSLCHGVAGNGYTFLQLYKTTGDIKHLFRACKFGEWCTDYTTSHEFHYPDRPNSLYEGLAGRLYFIVDLQNPQQSKFPGFEL